MVPLVVAAVVMSLFGVAVGWAIRGRAGRWCPRCGDIMSCPTCRPVSVTGRASVRLYGQPQPSTVDSDRPLLTRGGENRAPRISRRSI